ncbi:MAG: choice-of-anchor D domain-containing protein [Betaproteobacteria bacterium]|nr:choice-of-anchor D domain-containing protein [Betaproteobacteria bacterium]
MSKVVAITKAGLSAKSCIVPAPLIVISPASLDFPATSAGNCSSPLPFTVTNAGTKSVGINYINAGGEGTDFSLFSSSCSEVTLAPNGTCSGSAVFCPLFSAPGVKTGQLVVYHDAGNNAIPLSGTLTPPAPVAVFLRSPSGNIDFGMNWLGAPNPTIDITVQNTGAAAMTVSPVTVTPPFFEGPNNCGVVNPGGSCTITVGYTVSATPTMGEEYGTLTIPHSAPGSPEVITLEGESAPRPGVTLAPAPPPTISPLYLWMEQGNTTYDYVYFTNLSGAPVILTSVDLGSGGSGYFWNESDTCNPLPLTLASGQSCSVYMGYDSSSAPVTSPGYDADSLIFTADGTPYTANLYAEVAPPYPTLTTDVGLLDFGTVNLGSQSGCQNFKISNYGSQPAPFFLNGPYYGEFVATGCTIPTPACTATSVTPQTLNGGEFCWGSFSYKPTIAGPATDGVDVVDGNLYWGYPAGVSLTGTGYQAGPRVQVDQPYLDFGSHPLGVSAPSQTVTFTNSGDASLTGYLSPPGAVGFSILGNTCGGPSSTATVTILPGGTCTATFGFTPTPPVGYVYDWATFISDALNNGSLAVDMDGTGTAAPEPSADFYPMEIHFGNVPANTSSASQAVSFANTGSGPMSISSIVSPGGQFAMSHDCPLAPATLAPGACCTIQTTFNPTAAGLQYGTIDITWTDPAALPPSPLLAQIPVDGTGVPPPSITASPAGVGFADQIISTVSGPVRVLLSNTGITDITVTGYAVSGDFSASAPVALPPVPVSAPLLKRTMPVRGKAAGPKAASPPALPCGPGYLEKGLACYIDVSFKPTALGLRTGALVLAFTGGTGSPAVVPLSGNGTPKDFPAISVSTETLAFGEVVIGVTSSLRVTVSSIGTSPLAVTGVRTFGPAFAASTGCTASQAPGTSCEVTVDCRPVALGLATGDLYIDHNASGGYKNLKLSCTGVPLPKPRIDVSATGVSFGNQALGTTSSSQSVVIKSVGTAPLAIRGIGTNSPFAATHGCPATLEPGSSCIARVNFTPMRSGGQADKLGIGSNDPDRPAINVDLSGTGCRPFTVAAGRRGTNLCAP